jgi:two-component system cell cycle sensor histidine kinase/response regulator CckA
MVPIAAESRSHKPVNTLRISQWSFKLMTLSGATQPLQGQSTPGPLDPDLNLPSGAMKDSEKSKDELLAELAALRKRNRALEAVGTTLRDRPKHDETILLLDTISTHVFYLADPSTYGMVNKAHADFFGVDKSDLAYQRLTDVLGKDEATVCIEGNKAIFRDKVPIVTEEVLKSADGRERLFAFTKTPKLDDRDRVAYVVCTGEDITERKNAERLLSFTQLTIDQAEVSIFWCRSDGSFFYVNKAACKSLGYSFDELRRMHVSDINPEISREAWDEHWREIQQRGLVHLESAQRRKNGEFYPVEIYSNYVKFEGEAYNLSFVNDISEKMQARADLRASRFFLENVIESIQDGVSVLDRSYTIVHTNRIMRQWYEESGPLVGQKCFHAYHGSDSHCRRCPTRRAFSSGLAESEVLPGKPGSPVEWLEVYSYPLKDQRSREITGVVEFVRDISQRVNLERQLTQAQKMEAIGTLSSGIAHDFNNILQAILGSIQLLVAQKEASHPDQRYLSIIERSAIRARDLTSRLLYFSRDVESDLQPLDLNSELDSLVKLLERSLPKMISIRQIHGACLNTINADLVQIEQVILNLAINASHAMPDGGQITLQTENVAIDHRQFSVNSDFHTGDYVVLTVSDTGTGMDQQTLERIFEPFYTTKQANQGTGLGLSMVYGIVKNHNGVIACTSTIGAGTTFKIYFPAIAVPIDAQPVNSVEESLASGTETILVVDDEDMLLDLGCDLLSQFGYTAVRADSGEAALSILEQRQGAIDLVLLDLNMPGMGGYKCFLEILKISTPPKVVVASGYAENGYTREMLSQGASAFLSKPYQVKELITTVRSVLDSQ